MLRVSRKRNKIVHPYKLHHTILECTDCERDLEILTSSDLTWSKHVEYQCTKATKALGFVRRAGTTTALESTLGIDLMLLEVILTLFLKRNDHLMSVWFDNDPEIESKYHHYNLCLVLFNNSYLEFTRWHYFSEYVFSYIF